MVLTVLRFIKIYNFPVTYNVAKIRPFGIKFSNPGVCLRLNYFR